MRAEASLTGSHPGAGPLLQLIQAGMSELLNFLADFGPRDELTLTEDFFGPPGTVRFGKAFQFGPEVMEPIAFREGERFFRGRAGGSLAEIFAESVHDSFGH